MKISKQRLKEIIKEETQGQLVEQEQLDEAIFGGVGLVLLGKLFMILSQRSNIQKVLDALKSRSDELPPEAVTLIAGVEGALDVVEENLPKTIDSLTNKAGKSLPKWRMPCAAPNAQVLALKTLPSPKPKMPLLMLPNFSAHQKVP